MDVTYHVPPEFCLDTALRSNVNGMSFCSRCTIEKAMAQGLVEFATPAAVRNSEQLSGV